MDTIFSKIIAREIPADIVYEDETVLAFLDIQPVNHGHTLVIPKLPSLDLTETDSDSLIEIMRIVQRVAKAQREVLGATGNNVIFNCGKDGGQEVFHTHAHVIPRFADDEVFEHPKKTSYQDGESEVVAKKLQIVLK